MSEKEPTAQAQWAARHPVMRWFDARERNALLALLAAAVLLILCSLAGGMTSTTALADELPLVKAQVIPAP